MIYFFPIADYHKLKILINPSADEDVKKSLLYRL